MQGILILDFGSQYTLLIARRLREAGYYSEIIDGAATHNTSKIIPVGIVLSGGPDSVLEVNARKLPAWILELNAQQKIPVLGICYGMQLLVQAFEGTVRAAVKAEYGKSQIEIRPSKHSVAKIFECFKNKNQVWMSHGDDCSNVDKNFDTIAISSDHVLAAISHKTLPILGLQFHPEVAHTGAGLEFLKAFANDFCLLEPNWTATVPGRPRGRATPTQLSCSRPSCTAPESTRPECRQGPAWQRTGRCRADTG